MQCDPPSCAGTTLQPGRVLLGLRDVLDAAHPDLRALRLRHRHLPDAAATTTATAPAETTAPASAAAASAKKPPGAVCLLANECGTGNCTDGACCARPPAGPARPATSTATGPAPTWRTMTRAPGDCATGSACGNAAPATAPEPAGKRQQHDVQAAYCVGSTYHPMAFCSGAGSCSVPATVDCRSFGCTTSGCRTTCNSDGDCASRRYCTGTGGTCLPRQGNGVACTVDNQCASNHCTDGFCCGVTACPSCQSCGVPGCQGTCTNVPPTASIRPGPAALTRGRQLQPQRPVQRRRRLPPSIRRGPSATPCAPRRPQHDPVHRDTCGRTAKTPRRRPP